MFSVVLASMGEHNTQCSSIVNNNHFGLIKHFFLARDDSMIFSMSVIQWHQWFDFLDPRSGLRGTEIQIGDQLHTFLYWRSPGGDDLHLNFIDHNNLPLRRWILQITPFSLYSRDRLITLHYTWNRCILRSENHSIPTLPKLPAAERNEGGEMLSWDGCWP